MRLPAPAGVRSALVRGEPVTAELVETVLTRQLNDLEPALARRGYRLKDMTEQFDAKAATIRAMFSNQLEPMASCGEPMGEE